MGLFNIGKVLDIGRSFKKSKGWKSMQLPEGDYKPSIQLGVSAKLDTEYVKDLRCSGRSSRSKGFF